MLPGLALSSPDDVCKSSSSILVLLAANKLAQAQCAADPTEALRYRGPLQAVLSANRLLVFAVAMTVVVDVVIDVVVLLVC